MMEAKPEKVSLNDQEAEALIHRLNENALTQSDKALLSGLIHFNRWLQTKLDSAQLSIQKLKNLFGCKTEKRKKKDMTQRTK